MAKDKPTGPAQPDHIEQQEGGGGREAGKPAPDARRDKQPDEDQPGADGFTSAGASEDTYD